MGIFENLTTTDWLLGLCALLLLGILIALILVARNLQFTRIKVRLDRELNDMLESISSATRQHVEVAGAVAYLDELQERPDLIGKLGEYSRQAVAASVMQRLTILGETIAKVQQVLDAAELDHARFGNGQSKVSRCRKELAQLQADQQVLRQLADQLESPKLQAV